MKQITINDVTTSIRRCWTGIGMAEREALCNKVADDLQRLQANPAGIVHYCACERQHAASDGCCNWCGRPIQ